MDRGEGLDVCGMVKRQVELFFCEEAGKGGVDEGKRMNVEWCGEAWTGWMALCCVEETSGICEVLG